MTSDSPAHAHASFRLDIQFPLRLLSAGDGFELWHSLSYRIIRKPDDLLAHIRRVRLCCEPSLSDRLAGALLDLDHVLDGNGTALRNRLVSESRPFLDDDIQLLKTQEILKSLEKRNVKGRMLPALNQLLQMKRHGGTANTL